MFFPDVQKQAQSQLDTVVGFDRLPSMNDFDELPYMRQVVKEALRCKKNPVNIPPAFLDHLI